MTTIAIEQETMNYWQLLKDTSDHVKLALISLLSSSLASKATNDTPEKTVQIKISPKDLEITPFVASIGQNINPLPDDFDYDKAKSDYLMQKYG